MASNTFGQQLRMTTWGESHGKAIGVVVDGCPAGVEITVEEVNQALAWRAPGKSEYTSPRKETDGAEIYSGVYNGITTGAPISIIIANRDADSSAYHSLQKVLRPGHAQFTYLKKYGVTDHRGGGRASARETACRVAAGVLAKKILAQFGMHVCSYLAQVGDTLATVDESDVLLLQQATQRDMIFCPDPSASAIMQQRILMAKQAGDSIGGVVNFVAQGLPVGLGDPVYAKLDALLASAMLSIPASKGFEIGEGFAAAHLTGSVHNDAFVAENGYIFTQTNHAGGVLGGISTGMPLTGRVVFKPTSSIRQAQVSVDVSGNPQIVQQPANARHDPCVAIRAVPVVEAMCALVLADALLMQRSAQVRVC